MKTFNLTIFTPNGKKYDQDVEFVQVHTEEAYLGILPNHADLISDVMVSKLTIRVNGVDEDFAVGEGVLNVKDGNLKLVVDSLEHSSEIDLERAMAAKQRALDRLNGSLVDFEELDIVRAKAALVRALNRINDSQK